MYSEYMSPELARSNNNLNKSDPLIIIKFPATPTEFVYLDLKPPTNIWDKKDVDKILKFDIFVSRFDEKFRESMELAVKQTGKPKARIPGEMDKF